MPYWNKGDDRKKEDDGWKQRQKKLKAKEEALMVRAPSLMPFIKTMPKSYKDTP